MKKAIGMIISIVLTLSLCACSWLQNLSYNAQVEKALDALETGWTEYYRSSQGCDGYLEIKNTRVILMDDSQEAGLEEVDCIVEFVLFTDFLGTAPYYFDAGYMDTVIVYKDGRAELAHTNPVEAYRAANYKLDIVEKVIDLEDRYNRTWDLN